MKSRNWGVLAVAMAAATCCATGSAEAKEIAGVKFADTATVGGKTLKLNGVGLRKKAVFKVYAAGLYVEAAARDGAAVLGADAPRQISMHFLREVDKAKLVETYREGFAANAPEKAASQKANVEKFLGWVSDVKEGTEWTIVYVPGKGTTLAIGGKESGTIEGKDFADVLFSLWLGPKPASDDLKKGLLGG
jgi:hypothetical protein